MAKLVDTTGLSAALVATREAIPQIAKAPIATKTYTGVMATDGTSAGGHIGFARVAVRGGAAMWGVKVKIHLNIEGMSAVQEMDADVWCNNTSVCGVNFWNVHHNLNQKCAQYFTIHFNSTAAVEGHVLSVGLYNAYRYTTMARTIKVDVVEMVNCEVDLVDTPIRDYTGYNNASYVINGNGQYVTGDKNDKNYNNILQYYHITGQSVIYGNQLVLSADDKEWFSITNNATTSNKVCTGSGFRPEWMLYNLNTIAAGARNSSAALLVNTEDIDFRYTGSTTGFVANRNVYLKCSYRKDEQLFYLCTDRWLVQEEPTSDDGFYYILIGRTKGDSTYRGSITLFEKSVFKWSGGSFHRVCVPYEVEGYVTQEDLQELADRDVVYFDGGVLMTISEGPVRVNDYNFRDYYVTRTLSDFNRLVEMTRSTHPVSKSIFRLHPTTSSADYYECCEAERGPGACDLRLYFNHPQGQYMLELTQDAYGNIIFCAHEINI